MLICIRCKFKKNKYEFNKNKARKIGHDCYCRSCNKKLYAENKDKRFLQKKQYYQENKETIVLDRREYRANNKEKTNKQSRQSREKHKEAANTHHRQYYKENKEVLLIQKYQYYQANKTIILEKQLKRSKKRYKNDIVFRLKEVLRSRLRAAIKNNSKSGSAVRDLGCSIEYFISEYIPSMFYLNSKTDEIMTWENYGLYGWHLDHIIPLDAFNLENRDELLKACHYTNLQPLWAEDNLKKGAKLI